MGVRTVAATIKIHMEFPQKHTMRLPYDPATSILSGYLKEFKPTAHIDPSTNLFRVHDSEGESRESGTWTVFCIVVEVTLGAVFDNSR